MDLFPRSASVRAIEPCRAIEITPAALQRLFERDVEQFALIQMNIGRELCRRLRATDELLFRVSMGAARRATPGRRWSEPAGGAAALRRGAAGRVRRQQDRGRS